MTEATYEPVIFYDRSRRELDEKCAQARFWGTEYGLSGIQAVDRAYALEYGSVIHESAKGIVEGKDLNLLVREARARILPHIEKWLVDAVEEQSAMIEAHLRGIATVILPKILETDEILVAETELAIKSHDCWVGCTPDLVTRRKSDGEVIYREYKTSGSRGDAWFKQWHWAPQLMLGCRAVTEVLGRPCRQAIVHGLYKGYRSKGHLLCELVHGWRRMDTPTPEFNGKRPTSWKGWEEFDVWESGISLEEWFKLIPADQLSACFPESEPIMVDEAALEIWLRQSAAREKLIVEAVDALKYKEMTPEARRNLMDSVFPRTFSSCDGWRGQCEYLHACWTPGVGEDPLGSGFYAPRIPHHKLDPKWREKDG